LKVFLHCDMEGASGIYSAEQVKGAEGRDLLIADVNSAAAAVLDAGVDELIVCDTHAGGGNFILDRMLQDPRITWLPRSKGEENGELRWMPGLNETVNGFMLLGHHAMAGTKGAFLPHTETGRWADCRINGRSVGEMGIEACFAGHWGVPVCFAQGDEAACREAEAMFPGIVTACVKRAIARDASAGPHPEEARKLTGRGIAHAVEALRAGRCQPFKPELPMTVTVRMVKAETAEEAAQRPGVERVDEFTLQGTVQRRCDVLKWLTGTGLP
jgi:D-amino peptidase